MIAIVCDVMSDIIAGVKLLWVDFLELLIALPALSVIVMIIRLALGLLHRVIGTRYNIAKNIIDIFIFAVIVFLISFVSNRMASPTQGVIPTFIIMFFDIIYIVSCIWYTK